MATQVPVAALPAAGDVGNDATRSQGRPAAGEAIAFVGGVRAVIKLEPVSCSLPTCGLRPMVANIPAIC